MLAADKELTHQTILHPKNAAKANQVGREIVFLPISTAKNGKCASTRIEENPMSRQVRRRARGKIIAETHPFLATDGRLLVKAGGRYETASNFFAILKGVVFYVAIQS
mmetsp:Transcript_27080/g.38102  ORF Transcript_27080/g.38102 Transcript_27080/m.38102 type:complete len:108 (-) Transcript_27080:141-464(-)